MSADGDFCAAAGLVRLSVVDLDQVAALGYRWDGARTRLYFQTRQGSYNEHSLIEFVRELRRTSAASR